MKELNKVLRTIRESTVSRDYEVGFHVTPTSNLINIKKEGLKSQQGSNSIKIHEGSDKLFFFPDVDHAEDALDGWLGDSFPEESPVSLLKVDLYGIKQYSDSEGITFEFYVKEDISPDRITIINKDF